ncbi:ester cyclase [Acinetobacter defluvii]|uniref:nuclear transport factor 2 family protein n=1 Tax=Acinetobacter defluvii TaxID=1871111 RepID=UPI003AF45CA2
MLKSLLKKVFISSVILMPLFVTACSQNPIQNSQNTMPPNVTSAQNLAAQNKKIVTDFYEGVFLKHQVQEYSDRYIGEQYIQHNPHVPDGKAPFVNYFTGYFKENPQAKNVIKRAIAEGDLVVLHVHSSQNAQDRGEAIVDIFRVENGKIVEHWDVQQSIPEQSANSNTMF